MSRALKIIAKALGWLVGSLLVVTISLALAIAVFPGLVFNGKVIGWGLRYADRAGIHVRWNEGAFAVRWRALLKKEFAFDLSGLCVNKDEAPDALGLHGCFERANVAVTVDFSRLVPRITEVGALELTGGSVRASLPPASPEKKTPEKTEEGSNGFRLPPWLDRPKLGALRISIPDWQVITRGDRSGEGTLAGSFGLHGKALDTAPELVLRASATKGDGTPGRLAGAVALDARNGRGFWRTEGWSLDLKGDAALPGAARAALRLDLLPHYQPEASLKLTAKASYRQGSRRLGTKWDGYFDPRKLELRLSRAEGHHLAGPLAYVGARDCALTIDRASAELNPSRIKLDCPLQLDVPVPPTELARLRLPTRVGVKLSADLSSSTFVPAAATRIAGQLAVELDPVLTPILEGRARVENRIDGKLGTFPRGWKIDTQLATRLLVPKFHRVVRELRETPWAIPAPLHALRGTIELQAGGKFDLSKGLTSFDLPLTFSTRLHSKTQFLNTDVKATVSSSVQSLQAPTHSVKARIDAIASNVRLQLPRLELSAPPRLFPDERFHPLEALASESEQAGYAAPGENGGKPSSFDLDYDARLSTPDGSPLQILSNLARAPIPIGLRLEMTPETAMSGDVDVQNFPVELFRRQASVDHFTVHLAPAMNDSQVDGLVSVAYTDYTVSIHLSGTVGKTRVTLSSDPPLPESSLVSVLLFGYPPEDLDASQASSAGNARAALTQGAMGLASLYLLASTPIQSIGYDPTTGAVIAKVRIGEGTSLNLGQNDEGQRTVGIRRRLSQSWALTSEVANPNDPLQRKLSMYLEWAHRY